MRWRRGRAYSQDLRDRVFAAADDGAQVGEAAEMLHVSVSYVSKVLERRRTTGETSARPQGGHVLPKLARLYDAIREHVTGRPDATIDELRAWLLATHQVSASVGLIPDAPWTDSSVPSWPGLTRPSAHHRQRVDGRVKPGHDGEGDSLKRSSHRVPGLIWQTLASLGLTHKKSHSGRPSRIVRTLPRRVPNGARTSRS